MCLQNDLFRPSLLHTRVISGLPHDLKCSKNTGPLVKLIYGSWKPDKKRVGIVSAPDVSEWCMPVHGRHFQQGVLDKFHVIPPAIIRPSKRKVDFFHGFI